MADQTEQPDRELHGARQRADELRAVLDALPFATGVKDREGRFLYINAAGAAGYGLAPEAMIGVAERDLLPPGNDAERLLAADREVLDSGRSLTIPGQRFVTREGRTMVLHMTREAVRFDGAPAVLVTALDVTDNAAALAERRQVERRLAEAQRLEGLGLLAGGLAHDFNNLLVGVLGSADLALAEVEPNSRAHTFLERIGTAARRLADLTRQMLTYSGRSPTRIQPVDLGAVTREMLELVSPSIPARVELVLSLPSGLPAVAGDVAQLGQVVVNLVMNAAEAFGDAAGSISIGARREFLDSDRRANLTLRSIRGAMDYLCLEVADDGPGMDDATCQRIFDPFFSTKGAQGRGLGLASVMGIVRAHQGALQVESAPGHGTRFRVWLPLSEERARAESRVSTRPNAPRTRGRVLVIDDENLVRETVRAILELQGLTVFTAERRAEALTLSAREGDFDMVLLDLTIPGDAAEETHRQLRAQNPAIPILLISGYSEPGVLERLLDAPKTYFLQKPFSAEVLLTRVRELLR